MHLHFVDEMNQSMCQKKPVEALGKWRDTFILGRAVTVLGAEGSDIREISHWLG
jgi:hypothetical protein